MRNRGKSWQRHDRRVRTPTQACGSSRHFQRRRVSVGPAGPADSAHNFGFIACRLGNVTIGLGVCRLCGSGSLGSCACRCWLPRILNRSQLPPGPLAIARRSAFLARRLSQRVRRRGQRFNSRTKKVLFDLFRTKASCDCLVHPRVFRLRGAHRITWCEAPVWDLLGRSE